MKNLYTQNLRTANLAALPSLVHLMVEKAVTVEAEDIAEVEMVEATEVALDSEVGPEVGPAAAVALEVEDLAVLDTAEVQAVVSVED